MYRSLALTLACLASAPLYAQDTLRLCTGSPGKTYHAVGEKLAEIVPAMAAGTLTVEVIATQGSIDNLTKLLDGECDGAIVQGDAVEFFVNNLRQDAAGKVRRLMPLYQELSLLLCHRDSGIDAIEDLLDSDDASVAAGAMGSGSLATWLTFRQINPDYEAVRVIAENGAAGALSVASGQASCLFEVIAPQSDFLRSVDENEQIGPQLQFSEVDDGFDGYDIDGQEIYTRVEFNDEIYNNLDVWGDPELIAITAFLVVSEDWARANSNALNALSMSLLTGKADVEQVAYGSEGKPFEE